MKRIISLLLMVTLICSCNKFMDIVPDNVPELKNAFTMRTMAERYLFTCYSWLPAGFDLQANSAFMAADEIWLNSTANFPEGSYGNWYIARGSQNSDNPLNNYWEGTNQAKNLWAGIRDCNIFLDNINSVPDMDDFEKKRWSSEVRFLRAYYHYYLLRMYGPVHIMDKNIESFSDPSETQIERQTIDDCFAFIVKEIDESIEFLPADVSLSAQENGRVSQLVAYAIKAEVLTTAASPFFNGNTDYPGFKKKDGQTFFNPTFQQSKWLLAVQACRAAINFAEGIGKKLYQWKAPLTMSTTPAQTTINQMSFREAIAERQNNSEQIWVNNVSRSTQAVQAAATVRSYDPAFVNNTVLTGFLGSTLNMALLFYSKNGVPIEEDKTFDFAGRYELRTVPAQPSMDDRANLTPNYTTIGLHFDREDRFYASLSFDGGRYFMSTHTSDANAFSTNYRIGGNAAVISPTLYSITGYTPKKLVSYRNVSAGSNGYTVYEYGFPLMRLADLYLLYAECLNEEQGPSAETFKYLDLVRARSGLAGVVSSWNSYSKNPNKPSTKDGLRKIIQRERAIELMFESKRYWDLLRWKTATTELNTNIIGWSIREKEPQLYYRIQNLYNRTFALRDYLWPLSLSELRRNIMLSQNPGW